MPTSLSATPSIFASPPAKARMPSRANAAPSPSPDLPKGSARKDEPFSRMVKDSSRPEPRDRASAANEQAGEARQRAQAPANHRAAVKDRAEAPSPPRASRADGAAQASKPDGVDEARHPQAAAIPADAVAGEVAAELGAALTARSRSSSDLSEDDGTSDGETAEEADDEASFPLLSGPFAITAPPPPRSGGPDAVGERGARRNGGTPLGLPLGLAANGEGGEPETSALQAAVVASANDMSGQPTSLSTPADGVSEGDPALADAGPGKAADRKAAAAPEQPGSGHPDAEAFAAGAPKTASAPLPAFRTARGATQDDAIAPRGRAGPTAVADATASSPDAEATGPTVAAFATGAAESRGEQHAPAVEVAAPASSNRETGHGSPDLPAASVTASPTAAMPQLDQLAPGPTGAHGAAAASHAGPTVPVSENVTIGNVPVEIGLRSLAGVNHFEIRLAPNDLGAIEIKLDLDSEGNVKARLLVDRPETLALLQRDSGQLQQALEQAGLKTGEGSVSMSLRDGSGGNAWNGAGQGFGNGSGFGDGSGSGGRASERSGDVAVPREDRGGPRDTAVTRLGASRASGLDLRI